MEIIKNNTLIYVDVDNTLVSIIPPDFPVGGALKLTWDGETNQIVPMFHTINKVKDYSLQGHYVVVHSSRGWEYAKKVVELLKLEDYVSAVAPKPIVFLDDEQFHCWTNLQVP